MNLIKAFKGARAAIQKEKPLTLGMMPYFKQRSLVSILSVILPVLLTLLNSTGNAHAQNDSLMQILKMAMSVAAPGSEKLLKVVGIV